MTRRRHHETSEGGEGETSREHYSGPERRGNRKERREAKKEARKQAWEERQVFREEIDLGSARLPRRLNVRLAEVEELITQLNEEGLSYDLNSQKYSEIKARVESLGDGEDIGVYEVGGRSEQKGKMREDLQTLRQIVRGLRTSLRRHTDHTEETPDLERTSESLEVKDVVATGHVKENTQLNLRSGVGVSNSIEDVLDYGEPIDIIDFRDGATWIEVRTKDEPKIEGFVHSGYVIIDSTTSGGNETSGGGATPGRVPSQRTNDTIDRSDDLDEDSSDDSNDLEDPAPAAPLGDPVRQVEPRENVGQPSTGGDVVRESDLERREEIERQEAERREETDRQEAERLEREKQEVINGLDDAIDPLTIFDDPEFLEWIGEEADLEALKGITEALNSKDNEASKEANKDLEKAWNTYVDELIEDVNGILESDYTNEPFNYEVENNADVEVLWDYLRENKENALISILRGLQEGPTSIVAENAYKRFENQRSNADFKSYLEKVQNAEDPEKWIEEALDGLTDEERGGMVIEKAGNGFTAKIGETLIYIDLVGLEWAMSPQYPEMLADTAILIYEDPSEALKDARRLLHETRYIDEVLTEVREREIEASYQYQPFYVRNGLIMAHTHWEWGDIGDYDKAWTTTDTYSAGRLVDINGVVRALNNNLYTSDRPTTDAATLSEWTTENAEDHYSSVLAISTERYPNLRLEPKGEFDTIEVSDSEIAEEQLRIGRWGDGGDAEWRIVFPDENLLIDQHDIHYDDPKTGLMNAISDARTLLRVQKAATQVRKLHEQYEGEDFTIQLGATGYIYINNKTLPVLNNLFGYPSNYNLSLVSKQSFIDGLKAELLEAPEAITEEPTETTPTETTGGVETGVEQGPETLSPEKLLAGIPVDLHNQESWSFEDAHGPEHISRGLIVENSDGKWAPTEGLQFTTNPDNSPSTQEDRANWKVELIKTDSN